MKLNDVLLSEWNSPFATNTKDDLGLGLDSDEGKRKPRFPGDSDLAKLPKPTPTPESLAQIFSQCGVGFASNGNANAYNDRQAAQLNAAIDMIKQQATGSYEVNKPTPASGVVPAVPPSAVDGTATIYQLPDCKVKVSFDGPMGSPRVVWKNIA